MILLIVEAACRSLALGLLVWAALSLVRVRNPYILKTVWTTVLFSALAMPFLVQWRIAPMITAPEYMAVTLRAGAAPIGATVTNWAGVAVLVYLLGALALLARFAVGLLRMARIRGAATRHQDSGAQPFDLRITPQLSSPATFGSTVLLPAGFEHWSASKLEAVLAHERAHVRAKDCYVQWLARLHACVFWFNPFAWWLQRHLALLAETTSDDAAIEAHGDRPGYAGMLLAIAESRPASRVAMSAARTNIAVRIERIISEIPPASPPKRRYQALVVALLLPAVAVTAASLHSPATTLAQAPAKAMAAKDAANRSGVKLVSSGADHKFYPAAAKVKGIEGTVTIRITVDASGHATYTKILSEEPGDAGFGVAASTLVRTFGYSNSTGRPADMDLRVKFELRDSKNQNVPNPNAATSKVGG